MPAHDLALLTDAARAAGVIALRHWRRRPQTWEKPGGEGPVTEADLAVDAMLRERLTGARPGYGWLSEETPDSAARQGRQRVFIVDPIDGTRAFIAGEKHFAHSLAVAENGKVVASVVYLPAEDLLYAATADGPATRNGAAIRASQRTEPEGATLLSSSSGLAPEHWRGGKPPPFRRVFRASLAWRLCLVAEGAFDAMLTLRPTWEWDIAAGDLIARQAGARVTDRAGREIAYNLPVPQAAGIIAAPEPLWQSLQGALRDPRAPEAGAP